MTHEPEGEIPQKKPGRSTIFYKIGFACVILFPIVVLCHKITKTLEPSHELISGELHKDLFYVKKALNVSNPACIIVVPNKSYPEIIGEIIKLPDSDTLWILVGDKALRVLEDSRKEIRYAFLAHEFGHFINKDLEPDALPLEDDDSREAKFLRLVEQARADSVAVELVGAPAVVETLFSLDETFGGVRRRMIIMNCLRGRCPILMLWVLQ